MKREPAAANRKQMRWWVGGRTWLLAALWNCERKRVGLCMNCETALEANCIRSKIFILKFSCLLHYKVGLRETCTISNGDHTGLNKLILPTGEILNFIFYVKDKSKSTSLLMKYGQPSKIQWCVYAALPDFHVVLCLLDVLGNYLLTS